MPSEVIEITVQYVNYPVPPKQRGSIKSSEKMTFWAPEPMLRQFTQGEVCKIEYTTNEQGFHQLGKKIGDVRPAPLSAPPRQRTNPIDTEQMFITALCKSFVEAGKCELDTSDITTMINSIRDAYRFTLGGLEKQRSDKLDDEIPY